MRPFPAYNIFRRQQKPPCQMASAAKFRTRRRLPLSKSAFNATMAACQYDARYTALELWYDISMHDISKSTLRFPLRPPRAHVRGHFAISRRHFSLREIHAAFSTRKGAQNLLLARLHFKRIRLMMPLLFSAYALIGFWHDKPGNIRAFLRLDDGKARGLRRTMPVYRRSAFDFTGIRRRN